MMKQALCGALLRMERMRQGLMLKQVCQGICVTSYLSKIEHGECQADEAIVEAFFARLGIVYTADDAMLSPLRKKLDAYHEQFLYGIDTAETYRSLLEYDSMMTYSPLCVDWLIVRGMENEDVLTQLDALAGCMDECQRAWRDVLWVWKNPNAQNCLEIAQHAADVLGTSSALLEVCYAAMRQSKYSVVHRLESRLTSLALAEGNTFVLGNYYNLKGGAYASLDQEELMMDCYMRSIHLLQETRWRDWLVNVYYNIGATYVARGKYESALEYLRKVEGSEYWEIPRLHKQALAYIRSGRVEEGKAYLEQMKTAMDKAGNGTAYGQLWYEEALMECRDGYLDDPVYLTLLDRLVEVFGKNATFGYLYFYREVYVQACTRQRQYKKALEFERLISSVANTNQG